MMKYRLQIEVTLTSDKPLTVKRVKDAMMLYSGKDEIHVVGDVWAFVKYGKFDVRLKEVKS